ncbi:chaperone modulator CbpM [Pyrinomonas methylaliphatogenes]|uniref:MerR HTH family regulatory protein n=1 Tax=Pyrinomonas methylaliphatogenes TaxID=454194 RepID=A0A0B6X1H7_9BACT|nr:chaperone modulator CbpM [Pyrinomonas methylaliphatogenes]CDM66419.1 MerR HTH family regulatory protein [Pyrinomonas methylaliphatogenes]
MTTTAFVRLTDFDLDEPLAIEEVAEATGAHERLLHRLVQSGLLEAIWNEAGKPMLTTRTMLRFRRMQRLHRDLGVNFAGAAVILDLLDRIEQMRRELDNLHEKF